MDTLHLFFLWQRQWGAVNHHFTRRTICVHVAPCVAQPYLPRIHVERQRGFEMIETRLRPMVFGTERIASHVHARCTWHHRVFHIRIGRHRQRDAAVFLYAEAHRTVGVAPQRRTLQLESASQPHGIVQILRFVKHAIVGKRIVGVAKVASHAKAHASAHILDRSEIHTEFHAPVERVERSHLHPTHPMTVAVGVIFIGIALAAQQAQRHKE